MAVERIPQSLTRRVPLKAYLASDHVSVATGKALTVTISKNCGAFGNPSAGATNATEVANGWYYVDLSTTDTGTGGPLLIRATASGVDDVEREFFVADAHNAGFDGVPSAVAGANGGLPLGDASGRVDLGKWLGSAPNALQAGRIDSYLGAVAAGVIAAASFAANALDAVWSTAVRVLTSGANIVLAKGTGITGFNDLSAAQVNAEADTALADVGLTPTVTGRIDAAVSSRSSHTAADVAAEVTTDHGSGSYVRNTEPPTPAVVASQVRVELATELAHLDDDVSSRLAAASYTAPDNADIVAIKARTDALPTSPASTDDIPTPAEMAAAVFDLADGVETGLTPRQALRLVVSALAGKLAGANTTTITIRNVGDTRDRIVATVTPTGDRTALAYDLT